MKYFLMSFRFNKQSPQDFGLVWVDGKFIRAEDGSEWNLCQLYDFGWGQENGFYRIPLGDFERLLELVLCEDDLEDSYGAASIIQQQYPMELKAYLLHVMKEKKGFGNRKLRSKLNQRFQLQKATNITYKSDMSLAEIQQEWDDWKRIAQYFS